MEGIFGYFVTPRKMLLVPAVVSKKQGIDLSSRKEQDLFKWFRLVCCWASRSNKRSPSGVTPSGFLRVCRENPDKVLDEGWEELVRLLDEAHYVRYDFSTKLLDVCWTLKQRFGGLTRKIEQERNTSDLSARLQEFKYIGPVSARIFTQEIAQFGTALSRRSSTVGTQADKDD
jgi:hypothetical protein